MVEEVKALRIALADREEQISKLRVEVHSSTTRVNDYKVTTKILQILLHLVLALTIKLSL